MAILLSVFAFGAAVASAFWLGLTCNHQQLSSFFVGICVGGAIVGSLALVCRHTVNYYLASSADSENKKSRGRKIGKLTGQPRSLVDRIGGVEKLNGIIELFFNKVTADPLLSDNYATIDMNELKLSAKKWALEAFSGLNHTTLPFHGRFWFHGKPLDEVHSHLVEHALDEAHKPAYFRITEATLIDSGIDKELRADVHAFLQSQRNVVLGLRGQKQAAAGEECKGE